MRLAIVVRRQAVAVATVPCRRAGFLSGLKEMVSRSGKSRREFPSVGLPDSDGEGADVGKMSGLELSKHQMLKQRALEAEMLAQQEAAGKEDTTVIPDDFKRSLLRTPMVQNAKLNINADGVETVLGNEAWAATNHRQLPQAPSKEDLSTQLLGMTGVLDERIPEGMLDAPDIWAFLNETANLSDAQEKLADIGMNRYRLSQAQVAALTSSHSTVVVLLDETGTKRLGACAVPASIADGSADGWKVATEEEDGAGATLTPRQPTLDVQSRDSHELTDAQRAARGLGLPTRPPAPDGGREGSAPGLPWQRHVDDSELEYTSSDNLHGEVKRRLEVWEDIAVEMTKSADGLGLDIGVACDVDAVSDGSQAAAAGVAVGDIVVGLNGVDIEDREMLVALVSSVAFGDRFTLNLSRPQQAAKGGSELEEHPGRRIHMEERGVAVFWEGPEGREYGFGGIAEDAIISQAAKVEGAWVTESGMVIREVIAGNGKANC